MSDQIVYTVDKASDGFTAARAGEVYYTSRFPLKAVVRAVIDSQDDENSIVNVAKGIGAAAGSEHAELRKGGNQRIEVYVPSAEDRLDQSALVGAFHAYIGTESLAADSDDEDYDSDEDSDEPAPAGTGW